MVESPTVSSGNFRGLKSVNQLDVIADSVVVPAARPVSVTHGPVHVSLGPDFLNPSGPKEPFVSLYDMKLQRKNTRMYGRTNKEK
jgi:hypothetical protein